MRSSYRSACIVSAILLACGANVQEGAAPDDMLTATLEMRADGGPGGMGDVVGLALRADGSVVVGDAANAQLVHFDSAGAVVKRAGRRGGGTGEYSRLQWVGQCDGSAVLVHDIALSRISALDDTLGTVRAQSIPKVFDSRDVAGCLSADRVLILNDSTPRPVPGVRRRPVALVAYNLRTARADTLRVFGGTEFNYVRHLGTSLAVPLGARTHVAVAGSGILVVESNLDSLWRYDGNAWHSVALEGIPAAKGALPVDDARARQVLAWAPRTPQDRAFVPELLAETRTAAVAPRIDALVGAADGTAWIGLKPRANGQRDWIAYGPDGKRGASTQFVWTFEPRVVQGTRWWGVERDSIGVETLVRYRVEAKP